MTDHSTSAAAGVRARGASVSKTTLTRESHSRAQKAITWLNLALLLVVPLIFSTAFYRMYTLPKVVVLLTGAAALVPLLIWTAIRRPRNLSEFPPLTASRQVRLVFLYLVVIAISTIFGVAPVASLFGSYDYQMGLLTRGCFFILFISLIAAIGTNDKRMWRTLWAMALTGLLVATYAFMQFFGRDPFLLPSMYTFDSGAGPVTRVNSTIGHADYLGNFLLYTAPLSLGLALASSGRARRIAIMAAGLSALAIAFTGTRGAWVGLVVGIVVYAALTLPQLTGNWHNLSGRALWRRAGLALIGILLLIGIIGISPASRNIVLRARSFISEGFTGAGRTLLWKDAIRMVSDYAIVGCGPEGFRKAFLPYKSVELARFSPKINNESSHNSYLDAALAYGLPGAILYVAVIASAFALLARARRRARDKRLSIISTALISSLAAVVAHNFFIFDQLTTGLYFFAFLALAQVAANLAEAANIAESPATLIEPVAVDSRAKAKAAAGTGPKAKPANDSAQAQPSATMAYRLAPLLAVVGGAIFIAALWYSITMLQAERALTKAFAAANVTDFNGVVEQSRRAVGYPDPTGDYHFQAARALALYADLLGADQAHAQPDGLAATRQQAFNLASTYARSERSLAHTLTPDSSYLLLAYLALQQKDADKLFTYASEAVRWDANFSHSHWLMAEAYLARGERREAAREAHLANYLNADSPEAQSAYKRSGGLPLTPHKTEKLLARSRMFAAEGQTDFARRILLRILRRLDDPCPDCHKDLASLYESAGRYDKAITEWQAYAREAPDRAAAEQIPLRIEQLKQKISANH
jgi:O-antigen ligase